MLRTRDPGLTPIRRVKITARAALRLLAVPLGAALISAALHPSGALAAGNMLQNPSLETASATTPSCWREAGYGTNAYTWTHTTDAHTGTYAENLSLTSLTSGDRKLLSATDSGTCAPPATVGIAYTVTVWYKSSAAPRFYAYYRNSSGSWVFWKESSAGAYSASSSWTQKSWTTPALPSGATLISVGLGLEGGTGSLTMDDFSVNPAQASGPDTAVPSVPQNLTATAGDQHVSLAWSASTDNVGVSGYYVLRGGARIATVTGTGYTDTAVTDGTQYGYTVEAFDAAGNVSSASSTAVAAPADTTPPNVPTGLQATAGNGQVSLSWQASSDNVAVAGYDVFRNGTQVARTANTTYVDTGLTNGTSYSYAVAAEDAAGNVSGRSAVVSATPASAAPPLGGPNHFGTVKSGQGALPAGYPQPDGTCASKVRSVPENRPDNITANNTMPPNTGAKVPWGTGDDSFTLWPTERAYVTGHYTGTTDEILQWGACKWGLDEDLLRADAVNESHWHQLDIGDQSHCGYALGEGSYGLLQVQNACNGKLILGGFPDVQNETALDVDFTAARDRACFDGAFRGWMYDGLTVQQDIQQHESYSDPVPLTGDRGQDYVLWGCIGNWFSGGWWDSGARSYVASVQNYFVSKPWLKPGF